MYDFLIVGSGLFGSICAFELKKRGKNVLVIDKRGQIGGNLYTDNVQNIPVHRYGPHIFHTSDESIWNYFNKLTSFNNYINSPIALYNDEIFNLPFNMNTFYQFWGQRDPQTVKSIIQSQINESGIKIPKNLEEQAISMVGYEIYEKLIKGYTTKQWGKPPRDLPKFIIKRLPLRFTFDNNYFDDTYQGIPKGGYNSIFDVLLDGIEVRLNMDYKSDSDYFNALANFIIYTGPIDEFFDYRFGQLQYRSLKFETEILDIDNFQGNAVVNYTSESVPFTRIIEHKHFDKSIISAKTVITKEFPLAFTGKEERYYPVNDDLNNNKYKQYVDLAKNMKNIHFGGRLGSYKYYDMHQVAASALSFIKKYFNEML